MRLVLPVAFGLVLSLAGCGKPPVKPATSGPPKTLAGQYVMELTEEERKEFGPDEPVPKITLLADGTWKMQGAGSDSPSGSYSVSGDRLTLKSGDPDEPATELKIEGSGTRLVEVADTPITFVRVEPKP